MIVEHIDGAEANDSPFCLNPQEGQSPNDPPGILDPIWKPLVEGFHELHPSIHSFLLSRATLGR